MIEPWPSNCNAKWNKKMRKPIKLHRRKMTMKVTMMSMKMAAPGKPSKLRTNQTRDFLRR